MTVVLGRGRARIVAERTLEGAAERAALGEVSFDWPSGAAVTGLALGARGEWLRGALLEAEPARELFARLTSVGPGAPQPTALVDAGRVLSVFPLRAGARLTARVEGELPTSYAAGWTTVRLPRLGSATAPAQVSLLAEAPRDRLLRGGAPALPGVAFTSSGDVEAAVAHADPPRIALRIAAPSAGARAVLRVEADVSPRLSSPPARPDVVIVLDVSRSRPAADVEASRAAAATYLASLPDARAQIVTFDRRVEVRTRGWETSQEAARRLWELPLARRNGSELDLALARAAALFDERGGGAPRRVLVLGDLLTRAELPVSPAMRLLAARGALTHLVVSRGPGARLQRDDDHELAAAARATGGLVWELGEGAARRSDVLVELVRPVRLHRVTWRLGGASAADLGLPDTLAEGEGFELSALTSRAVTHASLRAELWASPVQVDATPTAAGDARWAALALEAPSAVELSVEEKRALAVRGHAVTDFTSLIVLPGEVRGSRDGADSERGFGLSGFTASAHDGVAGHGHGRVGVLPRLDGAAKLRALLSPAWRACGGVGAGAIVVETTRDEVAHARIEALPPDAPSTLGPCAVEAAFAVELPAEFTGAHHVWRVALGAD